MRTRIFGGVLFIIGIGFGFWGCGRETPPPAPMTIVPDAPAVHYGPTIELVDVAFMPVDAQGRLPNNGFEVNLHLRTHQMEERGFAVAAELEARGFSEGDTAVWSLRDSEVQRVLHPEAEGELIFTTLRGAGPSLEQRVVLRLEGADSAVQIIGLPRSIPITTTYEF